MLNSVDLMQKANIVSTDIRLKTSNNKKNQTCPQFVIMYKKAELCTTYVRSKANVISNDDRSKPSNNKKNRTCPQFAITFKEMNHREDMRCRGFPFRAYSAAFNPMSHF